MSLPAFGSPGYSNLLHQPDSILFHPLPLPGTLKSRRNAATDGILFVLLATC